MFRPSGAFGSSVATLLRAVVALGIASAIWAPAQNPITQLVTGKKPAASTTPAPASNPPATPPPTPQEPAAPQIIPLPDVAMQSEQLTLRLNSLLANLPKPEDLKNLNTAVKEHGATLETKRTEVDSLLEGGPSSIELREQENYWRGFQGVSSDWRKQLLAWANAAQNTINELDQYEPQWSATLGAYKAEGELEPLLELVRQNLAAIHKLRAQATEELQSLVKMQIAVGAQDQAAAEILARLNTAQQVLA